MKLALRLLLLVLYLLIFSYCSYRASALAFTYDEAWSFLAYAQNGLWDMLANTAPAANNHVGYNVLNHFIGMAFGLDEWFLRFPSLLSGVLAYLGLFTILRKWAGKWHLPLFLLLLLQPYLWDYFTLARGYGLGIACLVWSVYFTMSFRHSFKNKELVAAMLLAFLAAWANFGLLLFTISLVLLSGICLLLAKSSKGWSIWASLSILGFASLAWSIFPVWQAGEFYYGGDRGFWSDTIGSLMAALAYEPSSSQILMFVTIICIALYALSFYGGYREMDWQQFDKPQMGFLLLLLPALGSVLQHHLFDTPFLIDRTALFLLPLFVLALGLSLSALRSPFSEVGQVLVWTLVGFSAINSLQVLNFTHFRDFKEHADTDKALQVLSQQFEESPERFYLGKSTYMNTTIAFYSEKYSLDWLEHPELTFCEEGGPYPYYYLFGGDLNCLQTSYEVIRYFPVSNTYLIQAKPQND